MTPRRVSIETTLYGKRLVSVAQLYQLHREVSRAAQLARVKDPRWRNNFETGRAMARGKAVA